MQRAIFILLLTTASEICLLAQTIQCFDAETRQSVSGVAISFRATVGEEQGTVISNGSGFFQVPSSFPLIVEASHIGYELLQDTLFTSTNTLFLIPKVNRLEDVVVTGQFNPQSAGNSVFRVQTIDANEINQRGAFNLQEVLSNQLNIRVGQDLAIGSASISLQGISSQNVKILIDGIPLVNRSGNGNGADLSQINLQNIERIEIVEGPMAVNFGANALAGVINLITKKDFTNRTEIRAALQTESAGSEYGTDAGRHVQSIGLNHRLNELWSVLLNAHHNNFLGFRGDAGVRQHEWNPKEQWAGNGLVKFQGDRHNVYYRFDALSELIQDFGALQNNFLPTGENQPFALDETYDSKRFSHQLQAEGQLSFLNRYTAFASFSDFERQKTRFSKNIITKDEHLTSGDGDQDLSTYRVWEFGGTGFLSAGDKADFQVGYQISLEQVGGGRILKEEQGVEEYAVYGSAEWRPLDKFTVRPGLRYTTNSNFGSQLIPSLQLKYDLSEIARFRASYGRGFRSPSVRELYFEFIDSNHRILGNPDLMPEKSDHFSLNVLSQYHLAETAIDVDLNLFYNNIDDQISLGQNVNDVTSTTYLNIQRFRTLGLTLTQRAKFGALSGNIGLSYIGRFNQISADELGLTEFFYSPEFNANFTYALSKRQTSVNAFYKYTGRLQSYFTETNAQNEQVISIGEISDFHWLDVTIVQPFKEAFEFTFGARNVFNITNVNNTGLGGGAHSGGPSVPISYGRSYFLKVSYNLNIK
jgi:outer membrane receptor for ferrienterochelin and colicins